MTQVSGNIQTHTVYCHVCIGHEESAVPRNEATGHGNPCFGALWHCPAHVDCTYCPHGRWCDPNCEVANTRDLTHHARGNIGCSGRHTREERASTAQAGERA